MDNPFYRAASSYWTFPLGGGEWVKRSPLQLGDKFLVSLIAFPCDGNLVMEMSYLSDF